MAFIPITQMMKPFGEYYSEGLLLRQQAEAQQQAQQLAQLKMQAVLAEQQKAAQQQQRLQDIVMQAQQPQYMPEMRQAFDAQMAQLPFQIMRGQTPQIPQAPVQMPQQGAALYKSIGDKLALAGMPDLAGKYFDIGKEGVGVGSVGKRWDAWEKLDMTAKKAFQKAGLPALVSFFGGDKEAAAIAMGVDPAEKGPDTTGASALVKNFVAINKRMPSNREELVAFDRAFNPSKYRAPSAGGGSQERWPVSSGVYPDKDSPTGFVRIETSSSGKERRVPSPPPITATQIPFLVPEVGEMKARQVGLESEAKAMSQLKIKMQEKALLGPEERKKVDQEFNNELEKRSNEWQKQSWSKAYNDTESNFIGLDNAYKGAIAAINGGKTDPSSEMKLLFKFIRSLDNSVVRTSETEAFASAQSLETRFKTQLERLSDGKTIPTSVMHSIYQQAVMDREGMRRWYAEKTAQRRSALTATTGGSAYSPADLDFMYPMPGKGKGKARGKATGNALIDDAGDEW